MIPGLQESTSNFIVDQIGDVTAMLNLSPWSSEFSLPFTGGAPEYMYGHRTEIASRLREMTKSEDEVKKYPLVALNMDIPELVKGNTIQYSLNIGLIALTDKGYTSPERMANVFKPFLYPFYYQFMRALKLSGLFFWPAGQKFPEHTKIDRLFWGTGYTGNSAGSGPGSLKELLDDPVDAIEIVNLKLNSLFKPC